MPRSSKLEIRSITYEGGGALVTLFVDHASTNDAPSALLSTLKTPAAPKTRGKRKGNKAADVLNAIQAGAKLPADIAKRSGVDKKQVHAYLAYHKKRGRIGGDSKKGFTAK